MNQNSNQQDDNQEQWAEYQQQKADGSLRKQKIQSIQQQLSKTNQYDYQKKQQSLLSLNTQQQSPQRISTNFADQQEKLQQLQSKYDPTENYMNELAKPFIQEYTTISLTRNKPKLTFELKESMTNFHKELDKIQTQANKIAKEKQQDIKKNAENHETNPKFVTFFQENDMPQKLRDNLNQKKQSQYQQTVLQQKQQLTMQQNQQYQDQNNCSILNQSQMQNNPNQNYTLQQIRLQQQYQTLPNNSSIYQSQNALPQQQILQQSQIQQPEKYDFHQLNKQKNWNNSNSVQYLNNSMTSLPQKIDQIAQIHEESFSMDAQQQNEAFSMTQNNSQFLVKQDIIETATAKEDNSHTQYFNSKQQYQSNNNNNYLSPQQLQLPQQQINQNLQQQQQQQQQQPMNVYKDISPLAREILTNYVIFNHLISNQQTDSTKLDILNYGDLEYDTSNLNFENIMTIMGEKIPNKMLNKLVNEEDIMQIEEAVESVYCVQEPSRHREMMQKMLTQQQQLQFQQQQLGRHVQAEDKAINTEINEFTEDKQEQVSECEIIQETQSYGFVDKIIRKIEVLKNRKKDRGKVTIELVNKKIVQQLKIILDLIMKDEGIKGRTVKDCLNDILIKMYRIKNKKIFGFLKINLLQIFFMELLELKKEQESLKIKPDYMHELQNLYYSNNYKQKQQQYKQSYSNSNQNTLIQNTPKRSTLMQDLQKLEMQKTQKNSFGNNLPIQENEEYQLQHKDLLNQFSNQELLSKQSMKSSNQHLNRFSINSQEQWIGGQENLKKDLADNDWVPQKKFD